MGDKETVLFTFLWITFACAHHENTRLLSEEDVLHVYSTWSDVDPSVIIDQDNRSCSTIRNGEDRKWLIVLNRNVRFIGVKLITNPGHTLVADVYVGNWRRESLCANITSSEDDQNEYEKCQIQPLFRGNTIRIEGRENGHHSTVCEVKIYIQSASLCPELQLRNALFDIESCKLWIGISLGSLGLLLLMFLAFVLIQIRTYKKKRKRRKQRESLVSRLWVTDTRNQREHLDAASLNNISQLYCEISEEEGDAAYCDVTASAYSIPSTVGSAYSSLTAKSHTSGRKLYANLTPQNRRRQNGISLPSFRFGKCRLHQRCSCRDKSSYIEIIE